MPLASMFNNRRAIQGRAFGLRQLCDAHIYRRGFTTLVLFAAVALAIGGCSTPNLQPFADGAASFSSSIMETNTTVEIKFNDVADLQDSAKPSLTKYRDAAKIYNEMAGLAAGYSVALADLGAAGETGGEAAEQIVQTVNGFSQFLNLASPGIPLPASLVGSAAGRTIQKAAELWTRLEAHKRLLDTMSDADLAVQELAKAFVEVYGRPYKAGEVTKYRPFESIVRNVALLERTNLKADIGRNKLSFYKQATELLNKEVYGTASIALEGGDTGRATQAFADSKQVLDEKARIDDEVSAYRKAEKAVLIWQARQLKASYLIADTAKAWAAEHQRLLGWFKICGGIRFLQNECGQFSAATLKALAAEIQSIMKGDK